MPRHSKVQTNGADAGIGNVLRNRLVRIAIAWQNRFGVAPAITSAVSEFDAAGLLGMTDSDYGKDCEMRTAVTRGCDFTFEGCKYQIKANRPSGRRGSPVTLVGKARNYQWDKLIWILYDREYVIQEAYEWTVKEYRRRFHSKNRLCPADMRKGRKLYPLIP